MMKPLKLIKTMFVDDVAWFSRFLWFELRYLPHWPESLFASMLKVPHSFMKFSSRNLIGYVKRENFMNPEVNPDSL